MTPQPAPPTSAPLSTTSHPETSTRTEYVCTKLWKHVVVSSAIMTSSHKGRPGQSALEVSCTRLHLNAPAHAPHRHTKQPDLTRTTSNTPCDMLQNVVVATPTILHGAPDTAPEQMCTTPYHTTTLFTPYSQRYRTAVGTPQPLSLKGLHGTCVWVTRRVIRPARPVGVCSANQEDGPSCAPLGQLARGHVEGQATGSKVSKYTGSGHAPEDIIRRISLAFLELTRSASAHRRVHWGQQMQSSHRNPTIMQTLRLVPAVPPCAHEPNPHSRCRLPAPTADPSLGRGSGRKERPAQHSAKTCRPPVRASNGYSRP